MSPLSPQPSLDMMAPSASPTPRAGRPRDSGSMLCLLRPPWGIRSLPWLSCTSILGTPQIADPVHRPGEHLIFCGSHRHLRFKRVTPTTPRACCFCYVLYPEGTTVSQSAAQPRARGAASTPHSFPAQQKPTWGPTGPVGHAGAPSGHTFQYSH